MASSSHAVALQSPVRRLDRATYVNMASALRTLTDRRWGSASRHSLHPITQEIVMRRIGAVAFMCAAVLLAGCGSDSGTSPSENNTLSGVFSLQWVNDKALPFSVDDAGDVFTITSDRITFQPDGRFVESIAASVTSGGSTQTATLSSSGTYTYSASTTAVSLVASDGARISGTVLNDTMQLHDGSDTFVFYRQ
jgi:hypothetical protein